MDGRKLDQKRLTQLIVLRFTHFGTALTNGSVIKSKCLKMAEAMGNPIAFTFTSKTYSEFRSRRMTGAINFVYANWQKERLIFRPLTQSLLALKPHEGRYAKTVPIIETKLRKSEAHSSVNTK